MAWLVTIIIAAALTAPNIMPYVAHMGQMSPEQLGRALGVPITAFLIGFAVQWLWNAMRAPAREAHNLHMRTNITAAILGAMGLFGNYAATAPG